MPRVSSAPKGKAKLTLAQLASYDDILTDALVDRVSLFFCGTVIYRPFLTLSTYQAFFWTRIRKNRNKYFAARGIQEENVTSILLHDVIVAKNTIKAENALLGLPGLKKYVEKLKSEQEKDWFKRHLRKYVEIYLPDCPFEVTTTNRYTITTHEAAVSARKYIASGKTIKHLTGTLVPLTAEEERDLDLTRRDFSIVMSSRKKTPSLFLGPARFANHDCNANAKLVMTGPEGMEVVATRDIEVGEEITVTYGDNYFGVDNCECLCYTCEKAVQNGWAPPASRQVYNIAAPSPGGTQGACPTVESVESNNGTRETYSEVNPDRSMKRKLEKSKSNLDSEPCATVEPRNGNAKIEANLTDVSSVVMNTEGTIQSPNRKRSRSPVESIEPNETGPTCAESDGGSKRKKMERSASTPIRDPSTASSPDPIALPMFEGNSSFFASGRVSESLQPFTPRVNSNRKSNSTTDESLSCDNADEGSIDPLASTPATSVSGVRRSPTSAPTEPTEKVEHITKMNDKNVTSSVKQELPDIVLNDSDDGELSELSDTYIIDESKNIVVKRDATSSKPIKKRKRRTWPTIEPETCQIRIPGDYSRTPKLLAQRDDRWVDCHTCFAWFVQSDAYHTRKECPRCERHSKLYGYQWPKTDKLGRHDNEERVMDHRTIHRFLPSSTDAAIQRRGRGVSQTVSRTPEVSEAPADTPEVELGDFRRVTRACRRATREFLIAG